MWIEGQQRTLRLHRGRNRLGRPDADDPSHEIPQASGQLTVSDRWVIFARKHSGNFLLKDIESLQRSVQESKGELPGPCNTLVMGPEREGNTTWKSLYRELWADRSIPAS